MSDAQSPAASGRQQRSARNYLLDRNFQLKYTALLVGIALALSVALGLILWRTSSKVIEQSQSTVEQGRETVKQGQETIDRGKQVLVQSRRVSQVVAMNIAKEYKDDPELAKTFNESAAKDEAKLKEEQERLERDAAFLAARARDLELQAQIVATQQNALLIGLVAGLGLLVICVGLAGIVFTHKVAGPIFKMKRLLRQVGEGKLVVRREAPQRRRAPALLRGIREHGERSPRPAAGGDLQGRQDPRSPRRRADVAARNARSRRRRRRVAKATPSRNAGSDRRVARPATIEPTEIASLIFNQARYFSLQSLPQALSDPVCSALLQSDPARSRQ